MATCTICSATLTNDPASISGPYGENVPNSTLLESRLSVALGLTLCTRHFIAAVEGNDTRAIATLVNLTGAEIKTAYEAESDTNAFTDTKNTKLAGIATGADVTGSNAPQTHKASHQDTGGDEISVTGLSGLLADDQHVLDTEVVSAIEAASPLTLPGFTLGGTMDADSQALINVLDLDLGTESLTGTFSATLTAANAGTAWLIMSKDTSDILRPRLALSGGVDTAVWAWVNSTHTGIVLSGALDANSQNIDNVNSILDVNSAQVVGTRVVDARCDDAINSGDATTDGVIDALRDAMITHGLIAAA